MADFLFCVLVIFIVASLVFIGCVFYVDATAETFELKKDEWVCTKSHEETYTTMQLVGKVMVPQTHTRIVCDRWERKK